MKELTSCFENERFEVFVNNVSNQVALFDKLCSCVLLITENHPKARRLYAVIAELLDQRCRLDSAFAERFTKDNDERSF